MFIEIKGVGLPNRGAELMLIGVMKEISAKHPDAKFVLLPDTPFSERNKHEVYQKSYLIIKGLDLSFLGNLIPKRIRRRFGLIVESEIDVVIDASGFAYSDQWGHEKAYLRSAKHIKRWKENNKKVIFMPQAFGPFKNLKLRDHMKVILQHADLIFARDKVSLEHMKELKVATDNLYEAPDFSNLLKGRLPENFKSTAKDICFITNSKMLEKGGDIEADNYKPFMVNLISRAQELGYNPYLLLHEGEKDLQLAKDINMQLKNPVELIQTVDALEVKGIIGTAKLVVSSRFHGLVSALSQGVPVIATGWSHKYKMLLDDYGCGDYLLSSNNSNAAGILEEMLNEKKYSEIKNKIVQASEIEKSKSKDTISKVLKAL
ncbi:polysaccharide pyruvyl transferase family protein [Vibrio rumoiensis]|uniref:Polysaccharide pyruvyl transferase family protein n=1 Tax=Vibrio rumoiensis TaxID=76258 RepID=A0ABW7IRG2_9VIBR